MEVRVRNNEVVISGYVNAVERNSKPLQSRIGRFIERIRKGAFSRAIHRNSDIHALINHDWGLDIGSTAKGNVQLKEDNIGLWGEIRTSHPKAVEAARNNSLVGWSFGFTDTPDGVEKRIEDGMPVRVISDLNLSEVSILTNEYSPAYEGTMIMSRSDDEEELFTSEVFEDEIQVRFEETEGMQTEPEDEVSEADKESIDYSVIESRIQKMKGVSK